MSTDPLDVLLLCDDRRDIAATVQEHINSLAAFSQHRVRKLSILGELPRGLDLDHFDVVIIHYSLVLSRDSFISASSRTTLAQFRGLKAVFVQDEYRFVDATIAAMREVGVDVLFTCVPEPEIERVYSSEKLPGVTKVNVLTGYVPEHLLQRPVLPYAKRPIDVGYRARKVPAWLGQLGREKYEIGYFFRNAVAAEDLVLDISFREEDRLYGEDWLNFVGRCKAMLGVESGASVFDFTGEIQRRVEDHQRRNPGVTYEELKELYFAEVDGEIALNQISPRCFEAAALRTLLVMYEGEYSGRMQPWRHYIPLKKDHSNYSEVVTALADTERVNEIIEAAYREVACNPRNTFKAFVEKFDDAIASSFRIEQRALLPYLTDDEFEKLSTPGWRLRCRWIKRRIIESAYRFLFADLLGRARPETREKVHAWLRFFFRPIRALRSQLRS